MRSFPRILALAAAVSSSFVLAVTGIAAAEEPRTVTLIGTDDMKWDVTRIEAAPGETIRVIVKNVTRLGNVANPHNFVLVREDTDLDRFVTVSSMARRHEYIAPQMRDQVIAATGLADGGEAVEVTFTVPEEEGEYPYVCTFPGHYAAGMKGVLVVE